MKMRPFWRYYGGKFRAAPRYPKPLHSTIVEPFAGAAGYAMRYPDRNVVLVERFPVIAEIWRYLIAVPSSEIRKIPLVDAVDDLPSWVPDGGRYLVGFTMNDASVAPRRTLSIGRKRLRENGCVFEGWSEAKREIVAAQVERIRHWKIIEGDFTSAPDIEATWFVDPPYSGSAGRHYVHADVDYPALADWCRRRLGQTIVCENLGADWLPFEPFAKLKPGVNGKGSEEVVWYAEGVGR